MRNRPVIHLLAGRLSIRFIHLSIHRLRMYGNFVTVLSVYNCDWRPVIHCKTGDYVSNKIIDKQRDNNGQPVEPDKTRDLQGASTKQFLDLLPLWGKI